MFKDSLEEFDESRGVVDDLVQEYQAAATPDYVHWNPGNEQLIRLGTRPVLHLPCSF